MLIALDYDGTYTEDPRMWDTFINLAQSCGHEVHLVTMRAPDEYVEMGRKPDRIHYTNRKAKRPFMRALGLDVQVWIDDMPEFVLGSAAPRDLAQNASTGIWLPE